MKNYTCTVLFNLLYDGTGRTCKIMFANGDKIKKSYL